MTPGTPSAPHALTREAAAEVAALAPSLRLALPRGRHRGRVGEVRAASAGASLEVHDFRAYQPGDDLRHVDWNAAARTGELILRVREEEVSPRVEVLLDGSRSMALSPAKAARAGALAWLACEVAQRQGLAPALAVSSAEVRSASGGAAARAALEVALLDGRDDLAAALRRLPPPRPCGLRVVVSDLLFEADLEALLARLARGASALFLVQVVAAEDLDPAPAEGARLVDAESGAWLDERVDAGVLAAYRARLAAHLGALDAACARVRARRLLARADVPLAELVRGPLAPLLLPEAAR